MKKKLIALLTLCIPMVANAAYIGNQTPAKLFGAASMHFGISSPPADTCDYFGRHFTFDATTAGGKNMLSILVAATMAKKNIDIWYEVSTTPGTTEKNGCTYNTLAKINLIGLRP